MHPNQRLSTVTGGKRGVLGMMLKVVVRERIVRVGVPRWDSFWWWLSTVTH